MSGPGQRRQGIGPVGVEALPSALLARDPERLGLEGLERHQQLGQHLGGEAPFEAPGTIGIAPMSERPRGMDGAVTRHLVGRGRRPHLPALVAQARDPIATRDPHQLRLGAWVGAGSRRDLVRLRRGQLTGAHRAVHRGQLGQTGRSLERRHRCAHRGPRPSRQPVGGGSLTRTSPVVGLGDPPGGQRLARGHELLEGDERVDECDSRVGRQRLRLEGRNELAQRRFHVLWTH